MEIISFIFLLKLSPDNLKVTRNLKGTRNLKVRSKMEDAGLAIKNLSKGWKTGIIWSILFGLIVILAGTIVFLAGVNPFSLIHINFPATKFEIALFFLTGGLISPLAEEIFFRGILYSFLKKIKLNIPVTVPRILLSSTCNSPNHKRLQGAADSSQRASRRTLVLQAPDDARCVPCERLQILFAVAVSTIVFALCHFNGNNLPFFQIIGGSVFALSFEYSKSLAAPVIIHVLGNSTIFVISLIF